MPSWQQNHSCRWTSRITLDRAGLSPDRPAEAIEANDQARVDGLRSRLSALALIAFAAVLRARSARPGDRRAEDHRGVISGTHVHVRS